MSEVREESLLDYFYSTGGSSGRVKNADILKTFKPFIGHGDVQLRAKYREEFKLIIDRIAVVKSENDQQTGTASMQHDVLQLPAIPTREPSAQSSGDDELDKDSGSKLDPLEKEWIYSAAGARVPELSHLLRQDPSLANKKTALHWAAKHGKEDMAALVADAGADVNTKSHVSIQAFSQEVMGMYRAKENLRDNSGHFACHYLNIKEAEGSEEDSELPFQVAQAREPNRNRKLASLFHSKKKWGSAEELAPIEEERTPSHQLVPPPLRPRKFSR
ncbi:Ankyrin repeat domain-containing protein SOWAHC [Liparis tanakae]|uniref:Ankyrin repeat domain-containing protein SOWAHC n=1 Tax=Liparis tanakae TaxID=230148 RepID=A0A4Z2I0P3_9TELE|nr:Ankyrin repeat domain-containing protein SOWAHC [Liparis tanakae]